jgi:hypothetical protein
MVHGLDEAVGADPVVLEQLPSRRTSDAGTPAARKRSIETAAGSAGQAALELGHEREPALALGGIGGGGLRVGGPRIVEPEYGRGGQPLALVQAGEDEEAVGGLVGAVVGLELVLRCPCVSLAAEIVDRRRRGRVIARRAPAVGGSTETNRCA